MTFDPIHGARGLWRALTGKRRATEATRKARLDICRVCPCSTKSAAGKLTTLSVCELCLCFLAVKTADADEACPDQPERWGKEADDATD